MTRPAPYSTALVSSFILSFTAQGILLSPYTQVLIEPSLPFLGSRLIGWIYFFASLATFVTVITNPVGKRRSLFFIVAALAMGSLCILYAERQLAVEATITAGLAAGLIFITWPPRWFATTTLRDWILVITEVINTTVGIGLLFFPGFFLASPLYAPILNARYLLATLFLITAALGGLAYIKPAFRNGWYARSQSIPWLIWVLVFSLNYTTISILIPSLCLFGVLVLLDIIPWQKLILPAKDVLGRRVFLITAVGNIVFLALLTVLIYASEQLIIAPDKLLRYISDIALISFNTFFLFSLFIVGTVNLAVNGLLEDLSRKTNIDSQEADLAQLFPTAWGKAVNKLIAPFKQTQDALESEIDRQNKLIESLNFELNSGKRRMTQLNLLNELDRQFEPILDMPVASQLTANAIQRAFNSLLVTVYSYDLPRHELVAMAAAGEMVSTIPSGYRQHIQKGLLGRAARLRKTQYAPDTRNDKDYIFMEDQEFLSEIAIPLIYQGQIKGLVCVDDKNPAAFSLLDIETLEIVANRLVYAWNRSDYDRRLRELIHTGITLSGALETETAIQETASATQQTLGARLVFITLLDQDRAFSRTACAGYAPKLISYLSNNPNGNSLIQSVINSTQIIRSRDIRKLDEHIDIDNIGLRGFMAFPIRLRGNRIGAILAFGKQGGVYFTEDDESLATLISNQAAAAIETTWLYQELRNTLNTATLLYQLSIKVIQAEVLTEAAAVIAETAKRLSSASIAGIVLFSTHKEIETQVQIDSSGVHPGSRHPMQLIKQAMQSGQGIIVSSDKIATVCLPLQTPHREYGVLWLNIPESHWYNSRNAANLQTLANQAAIALERGILLAETRRQREEIHSAYQELEKTYDQTLIALSSALDARDHETEGHCLRVGRLTYSLAQRLKLNPEQLKSLERGALLHDMGKIGISDTILLKPGPLTDDEWHMMRQHPDIGARMIEGITFLQDTLPVIRYHQERWNGSGYPIGLKEHEIPLPARIFAVADVFDALTSTRPYRQRISITEAMNYISEQGGILFDPEVVSILNNLVQEGEIFEFLAS
jgi:putative nucleotidyltransferase with HDIG domain